MVSARVPARVAAAAFSTALRGKMGDVISSQGAAEEARRASRPNAPGDAPPPPSVCACAAAPVVRVAPTPAGESSYVRGAEHPPLLEHTLGEILGLTAAAYPDREAVVSVFQGLRWTYRDLLAAVSDVGRGLLALGVSHGERVGIWACNCAEYIALQFAVAKGARVGEGAGTGMHEPVPGCVPPMPRPPPICR